MHRLFDRDENVRLDILSALRDFLACKAAAEWIAASAHAAEKLFEEIAKPGAAEMELRAAIPLAAKTVLPLRRRLRSAAFPVRTECIVFLPLLRVAQNLVGFVDFLKFRLGGLLVLLLRDIGVVLPRELAKSLANLVLRRRFRYAEGLVVILELNRHG